MHRIQQCEEVYYIKDGHVYRDVFAIWKKNRVPIYREIDDGRFFIRNVSYEYIAGWLMSVPGEVIKGYWGTETVKDTGWELYSKQQPWGDGDTAREKQLADFAKVIIKQYPAFKYVLKKWEPDTTMQMMQALIVWIEHPDVEYLFAMGFKNIAFSVAFYRLTDEKKKAYLQWIRKHPAEKEVTYNDLVTIFKYNTDMQSLNDFRVFRALVHSSVRPVVSFSVYKYLQKQIDKGVCDSEYTAGNLYRDYRAMAITAGHDINEHYWKFPADLRKAHEKVIEEVHRIERQKKKNEQNRAKKIVAKFADYDCNISGYRIFVTGDYSVWQYHADVLHQCICAGGYYKSMSRGDFIIVFIHKDGLPIATAQVFPSGNVGQFYMDEHDYKNCLPTPEVKKVFAEWKAKVPSELFNCKKKKGAA